MKQLNESLIPESGKKEAEGGNYFCTWCTQSAMLDPSSGGNDKAAAMRDMLTEQFLFSESDGILTDDRMLPVRGDLTVVLDDGWDVPPGTENPSHSNRFGSLHIALEKFPFLQAAGSPEEALKEMNERMLSLGYRGTGVWVSPQIPWPDGSLSPKRSMSEFRKHWEDCAALCDRAGIRYWKVDWGNCGSAEHRKIITEALRESAPGIRIEHALVQNPLTPENPDFLKDRLEKTKDNEEQAKLGHAKREENVKDVYSVCDKDAVKGRKILLVDDVLTTGATASEVARVLIKAKAKSVSVLTFASTKYKVASENAAEEEDYEEQMV